MATTPADESDPERFDDFVCRIHLEIDPPHSVILFAPGCDGRKFVGVFQEVWGKVPSEDRNALLAYWRQSGDWFPTVELSDLWLDSSTSFGQTSLSGKQFRFSARDFAEFPDEVASWIVAHELAHSYRHASGLVRSGESESEKERETDEIATSWGFCKAHRILLGIMQQDQGHSVAEACAEMRRIESSPDESNQDELA
jgi:hypothetical protein